jgi:putative membrane protein insertion efficiency factor
MRSWIGTQVTAASSSVASEQTGGARPAPTHVAAIRSEERSIPVRGALFALRFYKAYLSILFAGSCRFEPTCSRYAYEAIERFGLTRGVWLGVKRLLRCHPLSRKFGYDPVPENWRETAPSKEMISKDARSTAAIPNEVHS